jgi:hypothetical protein
MLAPVSGRGHEKSSARPACASKESPRLKTFVTPSARVLVRFPLHVILSVEAAFPSTIVPETTKLTGHDCRHRKGHSRAQSAAAARTYSRCCFGRPRQRRFWQSQFRRCEVEQETAFVVLIILTERIGFAVNELIIAATQLGTVSTGTVSAALFFFNP